MAQITFQSVNPYSLQIIHEYPVLKRLALDQKIRNAEKAYLSWRKTSFAFRSDRLLKMTALLKAQRETLARLICSEMGKTMTEARSEIDKCSTVCEYYAVEGENLLTDQVQNTPFLSKITYEPIGCVLAIMPWNFPFWQVFRFATASLMAGNVVMLKHAPNVCGCSLAIEKLFLEAAYPEGVFQSLIMEVSDIEYVANANIVQALTLTGSERAGVAVGALAGKLIKRSILELGGSDPFLVLADADLDKAAKIAVQSRLFNAGQTCISAKRFLVTKENSEIFTQKMLENLQKYQLGDPNNENTSLAPLARLDLAENLARQIENSVKAGAKKILGGLVENCRFEATLLVENTAQMAVFQEETFGPVAAIFVARNEEEMIHLANQNRYGLAASVWSEDRDRAEKIAREIEAGSVFINSLVRSDARLPFGGTKKSGYGRELAAEGIRAFTNLKTLVIE